MGSYFALLSCAVDKDEVQHVAVSPDHVIGIAPDSIRLGGDAVPAARVSFVNGDMVYVVDEAGVSTAEQLVVSTVNTLENTS